MDLHIKEDETEHVLHLWKPFRFETPAGYDYRLRHPVHDFFYYLVRLALHPFLYLFNYLMFGLRVSGRRNLRSLGRSGAVTVCNHVHPMDCTFLDFALLPRRVYYLTLESNFRIPIARHLIRFFGGVPLPERPRRVCELFDEMAAAAKDGCFVQIYPEGVMKPYADGLQDFRDGAFHLAAKRQLPVLPAVVTYRRPAGLLRLWKRKPCMRLTLLEPVFPDPALPRRDATADLAIRCRQVMEQALSDSAR